MMFVTTGGNEHLNITNLVQFLIEKNLVEVFPNIHIALRMYKSMAVSNCSSERSFSCSKRIKSYSCSAMSEDRLNDLAILNIESGVVESNPSEAAIREFCDRKFRKKAR